MKNILKLLIISALLIIPQTAQATPPEYEAEELLTTKQENEIVLESNDELFDANSQTQEVKQIAENENNIQEDEPGEIATLLKTHIKLSTIFLCQPVI